MFAPKNIDNINIGPNVFMSFKTVVPLVLAKPYTEIRMMKRIVKQDVTFSRKSLLFHIALKSNNTKSFQMTGSAFW